MCQPLAHSSGSYAFSQHPNHLLVDFCLQEGHCFGLLVANLKCSGDLRGAMPFLNSGTGLGQTSVFTSISAGKMNMDTNNKHLEIQRSLEPTKDQQKHTQQQKRVNQSEEMYTEITRFSALLEHLQLTNEVHRIWWPPRLRC